jgi:hypothetical protein
LDPAEYVGIFYPKTGAKTATETLCKLFVLEHRKMAQVQKYKNTENFTQTPYFKALVQYHVVCLEVGNQPNTK